MERCRSRRVLTAVLGVVVAGAVLGASAAPVSAHRGDPVSTFAGDGATVVPNAPEEGGAEDVVVQSTARSSSSATARCRSTPARWW